MAKGKGGAAVIPIPRGTPDRRRSFRRRVGHPPRWCRASFRERRRARKDDRQRSASPRDVAPDGAPSSSTSGPCDDLRAVALRFGPEHATAKTRALAAAASRAVTDVAVLLAYHDCLLCLLAYPETRALRDTARRELKRVAAAARELFGSGPARTRAKLANSGIAFTDVTINFGWDIARWLVERFPRRADIDSFGEHGLPPQEIIGEALVGDGVRARRPRCAAARIHRGSGRRRAGHAPRLARRRRSCDCRCTDALRGQLWDAMQPFIVIRPGRSMLSRTFARGLPAPTLLSPRRTPAPDRPSRARRPRRCRRRGAFRAPSGNR